jgi:hypothetical protein
MHFKVDALDASSTQYFILKTAVEPRHKLSEYARNVVGLGEMEHKTAGLFEPEG